ncbi:MAG: phage tail family protein [Eubacteriales bacterium]|nr:phage tail family protein [Eubacteriales bacterium]
MQKLIYQNIRGQQAVFFHEPYILCKVRGVGMSDVDVTAVSGAYQQGESVTALRREGRKVKLTLHVMASSRKEMYRLRRELLGILSPSLAFDGVNRAKLIYENDYGRRWTWAVPESGLDWGDRKRDVQPSVTLSFRCECPYWFGIRKNEIDFRARAPGFKTPMKLPLKLGSKVFGITARNDGQADAPVLVTIEGKGEQPELRNESTGESVKLISPLPDGDTLVLNTDPSALSVLVRHANGSEENGFGLLDAGSSIAAFGLRPGDNELRYVPDGESAGSVIRVSWYDLYEGV